ncbi:hypothetical protein D046_4062B, partial [Vibrio parahaemolyticus V-223/04]
LTLWESDLVGG